MLAADCLDGVVGKVCARGDQNIDVTRIDEVGDDSAHAAGDHCPGKSEELDGFPVAKHILVDIDRTPQRSAVIGAGISELLDKLVYGHSRSNPCLHYRRS